MFIVNLNRMELLHFIEKGSICCEIGVFRGGFSEQIMKTINPERLVLVDSWILSEKEYCAFPDTPEHFSYMQGIILRAFGEENVDKSQEHFQVDLIPEYEKVKSKFAEYPFVDIIRESSYLAVNRFPDSYFDFVYVDASHQYEWVLRDLLEWSKKVKPGGIIGLNDCCNSPCGRRQNLGVLEAVCQFLKRSHWKCIVLTLNDFSELWITNDLNAPSVKNFIKGLLRKAPCIIEVDDSLLASYNHKVYTIGLNEHKLTPSFHFGGDIESLI